MNGKLTNLLLELLELLDKGEKFRSDLSAKNQHGHHNTYNVVQS